MFYAAWNSWGCGRSEEPDNGWVPLAFKTKTMRDEWIDEANPYIDPRAITRSLAEKFLGFRSFTFKTDMSEAPRFNAFSIYPDTRRK